MERRQLVGQANILEEGNISEEARLNDTLTRCVKQLSALNANLQTKLQERFQENFKWELRSLRSLSARSGRTKSARVRDGDARSDGDGSQSALSASALGTMLTNFSQLDLSENEIVN